MMVRQTKSANKKSTGTKSRTNEIDRHIGVRVRQRRLVLGLSQTELAEQLGITFQQIQKYEKGTNRISAGRIYEIASVLDVPVNFFFMENDFGGKDDAKNLSVVPVDMNARETLVFLSMYYSIKDEQVRKNLIKLAKAMSGGI